MPGESSQFSTSRNIPDFEGTVLTSRNNPAFIRAQGALPNPVSVTGEGVQLIPAGRVPNFQRFKIAIGNYPGAVEAYHTNSTNVSDAC